ncbi:MAG: S1C family serine protease [Acidiferrobacterales bacterium]|nr:S1C family serine protease [Acidiferrobacterales bacterium]
MMNANPSSAIDRLMCTLLGSIFAALLIISPTFASQDSDDLVEATIQAVVGLRSIVPDSARTANSLGTEREGSGIVIGDDGLVLTIGYLILEASDVEVTDIQGNYVPAEIVAYDYDSGFGLVRAIHSMGIRGIPLGESSLLSPDDAALIISHIGPDYMQVVQIVDIREFPGYWEYLLDQAIFTTPPFSGFGGAALISTNGRLVGVGSLIVNDATTIDGSRPVPGNMFVPIDLLKPIFNDLLLHGRAAGEQRPWLGVYTAVDRGHLFVFRVAFDSPAEKAGIKLNDIIVAVNGQPVSGMASFYKNVWATGPAGVDVRISVVRNGIVREIVVESGDRYDWLRTNPTPQYSAMLN